MRNFESTPAVSFTVDGEVFHTRKGGIAFSAVKRLATEAAELSEIEDLDKQMNAIETILRNVLDPVSFKRLVARMNPTPEQLEDENAPPFIGPDMFAEILQFLIAEVGRTANFTMPSPTPSADG